MRNRNVIDKKQKAKREDLKKAIEYADSYVESSRNIIVNVIGVLLVFALFYGITFLVTKNMSPLHTNKPEKTPAVIQYKEILAGETFNRTDSTYYVLFFDFKGANAKFYQSIAENATQKVYTVNISNVFNRPYTSDTTNKEAQNASELKVKEATLIKIQDGMSVGYYEGNLTALTDNIK